MEAFWNDSDLVYYSSRSLLCLLEGCLLACLVWRRRPKYVSTFISAAKTLWVNIRQTDIDERINQRFEEWRLRRFSTMVKNLHMVSSFLVLAVACKQEFALSRWADSSQEVRIQIFLDVFFGLCWLTFVGSFASHPFTARSADRFFITFVLFAIIRSATQDKMQYQGLRGVAWSIQFTISFCYMRPSVCIVGSFSLLLSSLCLHFDAQSAVFGKNFGEFAMFLVCTLLPVQIKRGLIELLTSELELEEAKQAMQTILSGLTDAVVMLNHDLEIVNATPQLAHILCGGALVDHSSLEGCLMVDYFVSSERERFRKFVCGTRGDLKNGDRRKGLAHMLQFSLSHASEHEVRVELFHVQSACVDSHHIIGLREIRETSNPPETEFFAQGNKLVEGPTFQAASLGTSKKHRKTTYSRSSDSSGSSNSKVSQMLRPMAEVKEIQLKLDPFDICEYTIRFHKQCNSLGAPTLKTCFVGASKHSVLNWYRESATWLASDPFQEATYNDGIFFRHPTAACASSNVVLRAERASLELFNELDDGDGEGLPAAEGRDFLQLSLRNVSQVSWRRKTDVHTELFGVLE